MNRTVLAEGEYTRSAVEEVLFSPVESHVVKGRSYERYLPM